MTHEASCFVYRELWPCLAPASVVRWLIYKRKAGSAMKKIRQLISRYEKLFLLWLPFFIILATLAVFIPQLTSILSGDRSYSITESIGELVPVVPESEIISEVKVNQELAPQEAVPETVETAEPASPYGWKQNETGKLRYLNPDGSFLQGLKYIDNKLYYFDAEGICASRIGVDVSFYNGSINWKALKKAFTIFPCARAARSCSPSSRC